MNKNNNKQEKMELKVATMKRIKMRKKKMIN
jgi:hypothetical protein